MITYVLFPALIIGGLLILASAIGARRKRALGGRSNSRSSKADARRLNYRYADDDIFVSGSTVWTGLILPDLTDEYAAPDEAEADVESAVRLDRDMLALLDADYVDCQDLTRYRNTRSEAWLDDLLAACWNPTIRYEVLARRMGELVDRAAPQRVRYRLVQLGEWRGRLRGDPLAGITAGLTGVAEERFDPADLAPFRDRARQLREGLSVHGVRGMGRPDLLWAIRKTFHGHREPPDLPVPLRRWWGKGLFDLLGWFNGHVQGNAVELVTRDPQTGEQVSSYVSTLVVVNRPPREIFHRRRGYSRLLAQLDCTVEHSERYRLFGPAAWAKEASKIYRNTLDEAEDRNKAAAGYDKNFADRVRRAAELRDELADSDMPGRMGRLRFVVSAPTRADLETAIRNVQRTLDHANWTVIAPESGQAALLKEALPGECPPLHVGALQSSRGGAGLRLWERTTDVYSQAIGGVASYNTVGDRSELVRGRMLGWEGLPIGWTRTTGAVARFTPHVQVARNRGAGIGLFGASGFGKSTTAMNMFFLGSESGVQTTVIDMKNDFERYLYYLAFGHQVMQPGFAEAAEQGSLGLPDSPFQPVNPDIWADTEIVNLATGPAGLLDPWQITGTFDEGIRLAEDLLTTLLGDVDLVERAGNALNILGRQHQDAQARGEDRPAGLRDLLGPIRAERDQLLTESQDSALVRRELAAQERLLRRVETAASAPFSRLLFGDGADLTTTSTLAALSKRRTIITMHGFSPPDGDPSAWGAETRAAAGAVHAALHRVRELFDSREVAAPRTGRMSVPPRAIFVDEAQMFLALPAGRRLLSKSLRQGRSLNLTVVVITQQAKDLAALEQDAGDEADSNQIGTVFCFANRSREEARLALGLLRDTSTLPVAEQNVLAQQLMPDTEGGTLTNGVCVVRDCDGNVASVVIDTVFTELERAAQTNPTLAQIDRAIALEPDPEKWTVNTSTLVQVRRDAEAAGVDLDGADDEDELAYVAEHLDVLPRMSPDSDGEPANA